MRRTLPIVLLLAMTGCTSHAATSGALPKAKGVSTSHAATSGAKPKAQPANTFTVTGQVTVEGSTDRTDVVGHPVNGAPCTANDGVADIQSGASVVVSDGLGKTLALGALTSGIIQDGTQYAGNLGPCAFPFSVRGVPGGRGLYRVAVSHRGTLDYAETDLRKPITMKV